jgi:tetratricopeptide (TPR) repeat protein
MRPERDQAATSASSLDQGGDNLNSWLEQARNLIEEGELKQAEEMYQFLIQLGVQHDKVFVNLGCLYQLRGEFEESVPLLQKAIDIRPTSVEAHLNMANALEARCDYRSALKRLELVLTFDNNYAEAYHNTGFILARIGDYAGAKDAYLKAIKINPEYASAYNNLGNTLLAIGDVNGAISAYGAAIDLSPDLVNAHINRGLALLLVGNYSEGWREYEWRLKRGPEMVIKLDEESQPNRFWKGDSLPPNTPIHLVAEQGLGDTIQLVRYVNTLSDITPENPLVTKPYLRSEEILVDQWRSTLKSEDRPIIAVNWQGNPDAEKSGLSGRSFALEQLAPLAGQHRGSFLSLQKGCGSEQLEVCSFKHQFVSCQERVSASWDFLDVSAIIANCDLVITNDTCIAHLAGAMGHPTWLLLTKIPDWRWGLEGESSFWYPSITLFRQHERGDWDELIERVSRAYEIFLNEKHLEA